MGSTFPAGRKAPHYYSTAHLKIPRGRREAWHTSIVVALGTFFQRTSGLPTAAMTSEAPGTLTTVFVVRDKWLILNRFPLFPRSLRVFVRPVDSRLVCCSNPACMTTPGVNTVHLARI